MGRLTYFHWPTFSHDVRRRRYLHDQPFFSLTMAVCAMSSARIRDGAIIPFLSPLDPHCPPSEVFYAASMRSIPKDLLEAGDFDFKRAKALLTMLCIQYGRVVEVKLHLGELSTMFSLESFHQESKWPSGLNAIEVEERRRLVRLATLHNGEELVGGVSSGLTGSVGVSINWIYTLQSYSA